MSSHREAVKIAKQALAAPEVHGMTDALNKIKELANGDGELGRAATEVLMKAYTVFCVRKLYAGVHHERSH